MGAADLAQPMGELTHREVGLKRRLAAIEQDMNAHETINLEAQVNEYLADLQARMEELKNTVPQIPEERRHIFLLKKRIAAMKFHLVGGLNLCRFFVFNKETPRLEKQGSRA
jgi:hypothetical protein